MLDRVGRYRVEALIGEGAMADVYKAFDPGIHRTLAIKVLKPEFRQNREYASRFLREAKAAGALNHPSIVTIYDVGQVDGYPYIAMELIDGRPLNEVVRERGKLPPEEVTAIGLQLADGLRYAHGLGVVHRDIKPSNIMLLGDGRTLKILDFGIARMAEGDTAFDDGEGLRTQIGQVLGSPRYMSPEQALGRDLDGRSDLFSVGVVLYELITGQKAFSGVSPASLAIQITQQDPPALSEAASDAPRGLQFIINKLLAKRPERRFRDGAQLAEALRREQAAYAAVQAEAETRRRYLPLQLRTTLMVVSITAAVLLASIATVLNRQDAAMQHVALSSGSAVAAFVANNAALRAVDNATLPPEQRDWLPTQAFVQAAASNPNIRQLTVVDADGIVRGSKSTGQVGRPYQPAERERLIERAGQDTVTITSDGKGFRFVRAITYAARPFGVVDVVLDRAELRSAADLSRLLMLLLGVVTLGSVGAASYVVARSLAAPIRRLKAALTDAAKGDLNFHISHHRKDEFGELFDAYNLMTSNLEERLAAAEGYALEEAGEGSVLSAPRPAAPPDRAADPWRDEEPAPVDFALPPRPSVRPAEPARRTSPFDPPLAARPPPPVPAPSEDGDRTVISPRDEDYP
ncbi:protein kinase [Caulobacter sp. S45]|uniref:protein kinase domain-containing protein n=1 Tax=Caulobacter sp. S45 TaxID=1641861 RepID=UPI0015766CAD|nr:protein kinase [Caulobacter sp. S45]